jgi:hypothetical protein
LLAAFDACILCRTTEARDAPPGGAEVRAATAEDTRASSGRHVPRLDLDGSTIAPRVFLFTGGRSTAALAPDALPEPDTKCDASDDDALPTPLPRVVVVLAVLVLVVEVRSGDMTVVTSVASLRFVPAAESYDANEAIKQNKYIPMNDDRESVLCNNI